MVDFLSGQASDLNPASSTQLVSSPINCRLPWAELLGILGILLHSLAVFSLLCLILSPLVFCFAFTPYFDKASCVIQPSISLTKYPRHRGTFLWAFSFRDFNPLSTGSVVSGPW